MSKKTRPRSGTDQGTATKSAVPGPGDQGNLIEHVLSSLWAAIAAGDPLRAELEAAICMAVPRIGQLRPDQVEAFSARVLVNEAIDRWSPEGATMLRLLMSLGSPLVKRAAGAALTEMTRVGMYPPDWVNQVGKAVPVQARRRYDVFGDDELVAVTFRYGEAEHGIVAQVDLTGVPVVTVIAVSSDAAKLMEVVSRLDDPLDRSEPMDLAEARRRLDGPLARCDQEPDLDLSIESLASLPVARSRVRRLPAGEAADPAREFTAADRATAVEEFMKSPLAADAAAADEEATRFWAEVLTGYSGRVPGEPPAQVGPRKLARILLGHVPESVVVSPAQRRHLEPAVTAWARWSAEYRDLDEAAAARLAETLPETLARFDEAYDDPGAVAVRSHLVTSGA